MRLQSNSDYWKELLDGGKLFSYIKDGAPQGFWESALGYAYPVILTLMIGTGIFFMRRLGAPRRKWKTYFFSISCGTFLGAAWCLWMQKADPLFPGWLFAPWSVLGADFGLTMEDWLFLPASTTLFYIIYRYVESEQAPLPNHLFFHKGVLLLYGLLSITAFALFKLAGKMEVAMFIIPGMFLYFYARRSINLKHFFALQLFIVLFEVGWDLLAVSLVHSFSGLAWASQWTYITFDASGHAFHSRIFLSHAAHPWAWLLMNPVEITPLFGICGGILNYAMFAAGDTYFYGVKKNALKENP